jgi:ATP synthase protein I
MTASSQGESDPTQGAGQPSASAYTAKAMDRRLLVLPLVAVAVAGVITTVIATAFAGSQGLIGGIAGTLVVLAFFGISQYVLLRVSRNNPAIAVNMALLVYVLQILCLFILLILLQGATFFSPRAFAWSIVVGALTWTFCAVTIMVRSKVLYVEPGSGPGQGDR